MSQVFSNSRKLAAKRVMLERTALVLALAAVANAVKLENHGTFTNCLKNPPGCTNLYARTRRAVAHPFAATHACALAVLALA